MIFSTTELLEKLRLTFALKPLPSVSLMTACASSEDLTSSSELRTSEYYQALGPLIFDGTYGLAVVARSLNSSFFFAHNREPK